MSQDIHKTTATDSHVPAQTQGDAATTTPDSTEKVRGVKDVHTGTESAAIASTGKPQIEPNHNQTFLRDI